MSSESERIDEVGRKISVSRYGKWKSRSVGVAMTMQGSGISGVDVGSATLKLNDEGFYTLLIGSADMGTGCDTILGADCSRLS